MSRLKFISVILAVSAVLTLSSCGKELPSPKDIVTALIHAELSVAPGVTYTTDTNENSSDFLSKQILSSAYGIPEDFEGIISAAAFLSSFGYPCEFAVFHCKSRAYAEDVALFCRERIDTVTENAASSASFSGMKLSDYLSYLQNSAVIISGRTVILIISSDEASARKALYKAL